MSAPKQQYSSLHLLKRRFSAWWEGEPFDLESVRAELDALAPPSAAARHDITLAPRLSALELMWGAGRLFPGDADEEAASAARLAATGHEGPILVIGPGLDAPVRSALGAGRAVEVREWRAEALEPLAARLAELDIPVAAVDLEHVKLDKTYAGIISFDCLIHTDDKIRFFSRLARALPEEALLIAYDYVGEEKLGKASRDSAFASAFAEPQISTHTEIEDLAESAGFALDASEDLSAAAALEARTAFLRISENLESLSGAIEGPDAVARAHELSWEAAAWRIRLELLQARLLTTRRFTFRRSPPAA